MSRPPDSLHVIVVDDDANSRLVLRTMLHRDGHLVEVAESGAQGLDLLRRLGADEVDVVISDYWMPGGTGLDLLKQIRTHDPTLAVLLVTAEGEKTIVADVLRHGGCGYLDKPVSGAALREAVAQAARTTREQRGLRATAAAANALGDSQRFLLQHHLGRLDDSIELFFHSMAEASGDFVSVLPVHPHRHIILVSDASGHDLRAAFQSNYFHGVARGMASRGAPLEEVFQHFNEMLLDDWNVGDEIGLSLAACGLVIDRGSLAIHSLNCGFPFPLISETDGFAYPLHPAQGTGPLGWFRERPTAVYHPMPTGYATIWTDGLLDLADRHDVDPLALTHRLLRTDAARDFYLTRATDDIAAIRLNLARYAGLDLAPALPLVSRRFAGDSIDAIDRHQDWLDRSLRVALPDIPDEKLADVTICAREAMLNALAHGCAGRADRQADVQLSVAADASQLHLRVTDGGPGHDFDLDHHEPAAAAELLTEHRGLVMMKHLPSRTAAFSRGACLAMDFALPGPLRR